MGYSFPRKSKYTFNIKKGSSGLGLFATTEIPRGKFVVEYFGKFLSGDEADKKGGKYLFEISKKLIVDGSSRKNLARYLNHSCRPNCVAEIDDKRIFVYTKRKVYPGEELCYSYGKEYWDDIIKPAGCKCETCK